MTDEELIERLRRVSGMVYEQPELLAEWSRDWSPYGAKIEVWEEDLPLVAISPDSAEDVAAVVRIANAADRPIMIRGGGSGMSGALFPVPGSILLDTGGLNVIDAVDAETHTVKVDAGVFGGELETRLNEQGFTLPLQPHSLNLSTVGGWIATRATGLLSAKYGDISSRIVSLETVLADGTVSHVTEPSQIDRICGSFGGGGVIASATLRVEPATALRLQAYSLNSFSGASEVMSGLLLSGVQPAVAALYGARESADLNERLGMSGACLLFLGFDGESEHAERDERRAADTIGASEGDVLGAEAAGGWWNRRHSTDWLIEGNEEEGWIADLFECWSDWSNAQGLADSVRSALEAYVKDVWIHSEQMGRDGMLLSFPFFIRERSDERALGRYERVREAMAPLGFGRFGYDRLPHDARRAEQLHEQFDPAGRFVRGSPRRR